MFKATTSVPDERVYNLLCSANYGAIAYWARIVSVKRGTRPSDDPDVGPPTEIEAAPITGGRWTLRDIEGGQTGERLRLDREACERGLRVMAEIYPTHFADLVTENDDATTADVFVQCALFGKVVYG